MMRDLPNGAELLAEARRVLTNDILPHLSSTTRYQALMVIRAIDLAENEFNANPETEKKLGEKLQLLVGGSGTLSESTQKLSKHIRNGNFDASQELHEFLQLVVAFKLKETNISKGRTQK